MRVRILALLATLMAVLFVLPSAAHAADYWSGPASAIKAGKHVVADPALKLISDADKSAREQHIRASGQPIFAVVIDEAQVSTDKSSWLSTFHNAVGKDGLYIVLSNKGALDARGFNTPSAVTSAAHQLAVNTGEKVKDGSIKSVNDALSYMISQASALDWTVAKTTTSSAGTVQQSSGGSAWGWVIGIAGVLGLGGLIVWLIARAKRKQREAEAAAEYARHEAERRSAAPTWPVPSSAPQDAPGPWSSTPSASSQPTRLVTADSFQDRVDRGDDVKFRPRSGSGGETIVYNASRTHRCNHYYGGGQWGPAGYYNDPFWTYMAWNQFVWLYGANPYFPHYWDNGGYAYDRGYADGSRAAEHSWAGTSPDVSTGAATEPVETGGWGSNSSGTSSGAETKPVETGHDWGSSTPSAPDPTPSYSAPDPSPSYSAPVETGSSWGSSDSGSSSSW